MKKEKDVKTTRLELRISPKDKELIRHYAAVKGMGMSEAVLELCKRVFSEELKQMK